MINGKADAFVYDLPYCVVFWAQKGAGKLVFLDKPFTFEPLGAAIAPNDALFLNLVQNYMNTLEGIGLMGALRSKWFDSGDWLLLIP